MRQNGRRGPAGESQILTETSDKEIYQAVIDSSTARENLDINSGDDDTVLLNLVLLGVMSSRLHQLLENTPMT
jgi:hypothetical protein